MRELGYDTAKLNLLINNANTWDDVARSNGVTVDAIPATGAIAQSDTLSGLGHVAVVESVNADGTVTVSASSSLEDATSPWNVLWRHRTAHLSSFGNYIHVSKASSNYTITTTPSPSAGGATSGSGTFPSGSSRTVTATAKSGYTFTNWTEGGSVVSSSASYSFTLNGNRSLVANFTLIPVNYTITTSASPSAGGSASGGGAFVSGSSRTVTATANSGYMFDNWTEGGSVVSTAASYTFTLSGHRSLVANFALIPVNFTITTSASPGAGGSTSGGGTFVSGSSRTVTATASGGYTFSNWTEGGSVVGASASYTFTLNGNRNLVANFTLIPVNYIITTSATPSAGGSTSGGGTFVSGSSRTVTATANSGYTFNHWREGGSVVSSSASYSFTLNGNRNLVAHFLAVTKIIDLSGDLAFGNVTVGSSAQRTLTIRNAGNSPIAVSGIGYPNGFNGNWSSGIIPAGGSQSVTVTFSPGAGTSYSGTVMVNSDKTAGVNRTPASGTGTVTTRIIGLSGNLAFGNVAVGSSAQRVLTISNSGNLPVTVSGIGYPNGFSGNWSGGAIPPSGSQSVTVTFAPTAAAGYSGNLTVTSDKTSGSNTLAASGTGTQPTTRIIALSGDLDFGTVTWGSNPQRTLTIRNTGTSSLIVSGITYPSSFSGSWSGTIPPGGSHNVAVLFAPTTPGIVYSGNLTVNSDATSGSNVAAVSGGTPEQFLSITTPSPFVAGKVGVAYSQTLAASHGVPPYNWSLAATALPPSLSLSTGGIISGVPTSAGTWNGVRVRVTDALGASNEKSFSITIDSSSIDLSAFAGSYSGLIESAGSPTHATLGAIIGTLTKAGRFTATVSLGGVNHSLIGTFDDQGQFAGVISRGLPQPLLVAVSLADGLMNGTITDNGTPIASILAQRNPTGFTSANPIPSAGRYTVAFPADDAHLEATYPQGFGYATLTVAPTGSTRLTGVLGDATAFTEAGVVSESGRLPVYVPLYGAKGSVRGWLTLSKTSGASNVTGTLFWSKPPTTGAWYPSGFSGQIVVAGSLYTAPPARPQVFDAPSGKLQLSIEGGAVTTIPAVKDLTIDSRNVIRIVGAERVTMSLTPGTGLFSGTFYDAEKKRRTFKGVVLQEQNAGYGLFQGNGQTGAVGVESAP